MGSKSRSTRNDGVRAFYADWLRMPTTEARLEAGMPKTKKEFAELHGVSTVALWHWEQDPEFRRYVHDRGIGLLTAKETEEIIEALKTKARAGNIQAINLLFKTMGFIGDGKTVFEKPEDDEPDFGKWSDEELEEFAKLGNDELE